MALIHRVSRLFRADFNAVLDHIEEPELLLRQSIRDMEDELADCDRRIARRRQEQASLQGRCEELEARLAAMTEQLDLCFDSGKEDLARNLVRRRLETESLLKSLSAEVIANTGYIDEQQALLDENSVTLEGLRQKAETIERQRAERRRGH